MRHSINDKKNFEAHEAHVGCVQGANVPMFITTFFRLCVLRKSFPFPMGTFIYVGLLLSKGRGQVTFQTSLSRQLEDRKHSLKKYRMQKSSVSSYKLF